MAITDGVAAATLSERIKRIELNNGRIIRAWIERLPRATRCVLCCCSQGLVGVLLTNHCYAE
ncbi:MAG: hypothetical protein RLZZ20_1768 [Pseudomonadota bacterium]|jgi:hypothetical protein